MEQAKTYTKRENARRAGVAAGVPAELVEITVHKNGDEVRFGWKQMEAPAPATADAVVTTSKPKKAAAPKVERIEQNGIKRPGPGKCLEVWEWLDANPTATVKQVREVAPSKGWNESNCQIEFYQWRRFNGISGRVKAAA
ncbi:MAG: hypothetical protein ACYCWC_04200 [Rhodocyclaceae bacterium]